MSNPAIVLMTDPSRCSLGDVHYLVQALLEMQQMGPHAIPQAFCDHPAAARDFVDAYAHAYPKLVLEDREIPTPDHLQSLLSAGQINAMGPPVQPMLPGVLPPPTEQNGTSSLPIVVLTLGSSQVLLDALQRSPTIRESIRLIDVGQDKADAASVSIADAVAIRGLDGEPGDRERSSMERPELDDIAGPSKVESASLALHDDQMNLDVVETADLSGSTPGYGDDEEKPGAVTPAAVAQPAPVAAAAPATAPVAGPARADDGPASATAAEPVLETAAPGAVWPNSAAPPEPIAPIAPPEPIAPDEPLVSIDEPQAQAPDDTANANGQGEQPSTGGAAEEGDPVEKGDADEKAKSAPDQDDVEYPPVGSLLAGADVLYPALDQGDAHGALHELAAVLLDDGILDPELAAELLAAHEGDGPPAFGRQEATIVVRSGDNVVTLEDIYAACDQESEDSLADSSVARPLHDSDL
jgi:hypothetical protein